jgi:opacity protein-like surface antigen
MYVPAPRPVPETFKWYVRADIGLGLQQAPSLSEEGLLFGDENGVVIGNPGPLEMESAWFNDDFDTFFMGGVGVGMYLSPRWRGDITVDARTATNADADGSYRYQLIAPPGNFVEGSVRERTEVRNTVTFANLYLDLSQRGSGVTPYIGVGVGFAVRSIDRDHTTTEIVEDGGGVLVGPGNTFTGQGKAHQVAPAAAVMAGLAYSVSPGTVIDLSYRFTWVGSVDASTRISNGFDTYNSRLTIGDSFDHQIRAGLRWNVW